MHDDDDLIDERAFSFENDEAEAQFYESVEREIEQTLAEGLPPIEEDEAERRIRAVIARFAKANVGESR
jgi:hypothetical protein